MENLKRFERDLEALLRRHRVSMVVETYPEIGSGFTLEPWDDEPAEQLLWTDWAMHKRDRCGAVLRVIEGGKK